MGTELIPLERKDFHKFWLVWNPQGHGPTFRHLTLESAKTEATRLARANHLHTFCVMECVGAVQLEPPPAYWFEATMAPEDAAETAEASALG